MKQLHLWRVEFDRVHKFIKDAVRDNCLLVVLPNNSTWEMAVRGAVECLKEEGCWYNGWDYHFKKPDYDKMVGCHIPSSVEAKIKADTSGNWTLDWCNGRKCAQQEMVANRQAMRERGDYCWFDEGTPPLVLVDGEPFTV